MSRLWTLQEAFLAKELWSKFADNSLRFEDLPRNFQQNLLTEDMSMFNDIHRKVTTVSVGLQGSFSFSGVFSLSRLPF
jgi:hypothetical protein